MEVYVNYPTDEEGWKIFRKAVADVHAFLVVDTIKNLPLSEESKKKRYRSTMTGRIVQTR